MCLFVDESSVLEMGCVGCTRPAEVLHMRKLHPLRLEASADDGTLPIFRVKGYVTTAALGALKRVVALIVVLEAALCRVSAYVQSLVEHLDHVFEGLEQCCQSLLESDVRSRYLRRGN